MKRCVLILLVLLLATPAFSADKWIRVQSKNFSLVGNATENQIRDVAESLEVFRTAFSKFFKVKEDSSVVATVVVFKSDQAFKPFKPIYKGKPANIAGFFQAGIDVNFIALTAEDQAPRVVYHELVHRLMSESTGNLPPWFQEGFAECFSSIEFEGKDKKVRIGRAIGEHVALLNERSFMPLARLFAVGPGSPEYNEEEKQGLFYAESWALVHYMMFDSDQRRTQFSGFLSRIADGAPAEQTFEEVFHTDLNSFQKVFEAYIQQHLAWNAFELNTPSGLDRNKDITSRIMSDAETEFYLGDLMLHIDRLPEAETHLAKAVQLDPKLGPAQWSMGRLLMDKKDEAAAMPYFQRATELSPDNYLAHYYYASAIRLHSKSPSDSEWNTMRSELQKSIQLAPQFVEAIVMLASANLTLNTDMNQTVEMLANAVSMAPGRDELKVQLANALSRVDRRDNARAIIRSVLAKPSLEGWIRKNAENVMDYLDRVAAAESASRAPANSPVREPQLQFGTSLADLRPPELRREPPTDNTSSLPPDRVSGLPVEPPLLPGTQRVRGILTTLDCRDGLTLSLTVDGKVLKFHSAMPDNIKFTSANTSVAGQIACGLTPNNGVPAAIIFRPQEASDSSGDPQSVEFLKELPAAESRSLALPSVANTVTVKGLLTDLDCTNGVTFTVMADGKTLRFHNDTASKVAFLNGPNPDGTVTCGPIAGAAPAVTVLYRPAKSGDFSGEPVIVQFQKN